MIKISNYYVEAKSFSHSPSALLADIVGLAGLLFLGAQLRVPLPFSPAPFTLQVLIVLVAPYLLGRNRAFAGTALFIMMGLGGHAAGFSLFAATSGATLGYLFGFLLTPWLLGLFKDTTYGTLAAMVCAAFMILLLGTLWLHLSLGISLGRAALLGFLPFVPGDLVKIGMAHVIVRRYCRRHAMPAKPAS